MIDGKELSSAVFIDRDGVINEDRGYVHRIKDFIFLPGAISGMKIFQDLDYKIVIVTNQAGIARGMYTENDFKVLTAHMNQELAANHVMVSGVYYCPHHPNGVIEKWTSVCNCRKPRPGMFIKAAEDLGLQLGTSILLGDKLSDIDAGINAGVPLNILIRSNDLTEAEPCSKATVVCRDLQTAAHWVKNNGRHNGVMQQNKTCH
jgi:D-glycero-D-manno-heptose 1,7-bisphosphate phosphatase